MKRILIATDGSEQSNHAVEFLAKLPHQDKLKVVVLSVVNTPQVYANGSQAQWLVEYVQQQQAAAKECFEHVERQFQGANVTAEHRIVQGPVGQTIVDVAQEVNADFVVVGARGHSNVERILLGSTSDYVATHAHCSVLVVRPDLRSDKSQPLQVVVGYEDSGPAQAAIEEFAEVQWGAGSKVHLVSVLPPLSVVAGDVDPSVEQQARIERCLHRAAADLRNACAQVDTQLIDHRHVGEGIVQFAEQQQSDLVVVGETPRSAVGRFLLGSVSRYVLRHAPCSVWITRNRLISVQDPLVQGSLETT